MLQLDGRTKIVQSKEFPFATGNTITAEGLVLMQVIEEGEERVKLTAGGGAEVFMGFSYGQTMTPITKSKVEELSCPDDAPFTVTLLKEPVGATQIDIVNEDGTHQTNGDPANPNEYSVVAKVVTFHAGQAGKVETITYRYLPTALELLLEDKLDNTSMTAVDTLSSTGVIQEGEVFTDQFDASKEWKAGVAVAGGNSGIVSIGVGTDIPGCVLTHVPSVEVPFLGLRF